MFELLIFIIKHKEQLTKKYLFNKTNLKLIKDLLNNNLSKTIYLNEEQTNILINIFLLSNNTFNENTPNFILEDKECILNSIKKDINSIKYVKSKYLNDPDIFKQLILQGYNFYNDKPEQIPLDKLNDPEIIDYYLKNYDLYPHKQKDEIFNTRINELINKVLNSKPTIQSFEPILNYIAECKWENYRTKNTNQYENLLAKISSYLQNNKDIESIEYNLPYLSDIKKILDVKYNILYQAINEYHQIYHSNMPNKLDNLQSSKDTISSLSALYVAKSKEKYKKELIKEYKNILKPYYQLKKDNPLVIKKTIEIKQQEQLRKMYDKAYTTNNQDILNFIEKLKNKYSNQIPSNIIEYMIRYYIHNKDNDISNFINISIPIRYQEYKRYISISKLINRLNSNYIKITDYEVLKYQEFIKYDETKKIYYYSGSNFTKEEIDEINEYQKYQSVYNNIIKDIMIKTKTIEITTNIDEQTLKNIETLIPFTDEYYIFNREEILKQLKFKNLLYCCFDKKYNIESLTNNQSYKMIYNLLIDNSLIWLLLILHSNNEPKINFIKNKYEFQNNGIFPAKICNIINEMPNIISLANKLKIDITKLNNLMNVYDINKVANNRQIAILTPYIISKLCTCREYIYTSNEDIINISTDLICAMTKRNKSTIPYISGETEIYKYSTYDPLDENILISGINTHSCFKIAGNDNDFLHYCALNKNGVVIKITDLSDNLIAKASGFRNGNIVYLNQLRTIFDKGGNNYSGESTHEKESIIKAFQQACKDIVMISQNNLQEDDKIDYVITTKSYILSDYQSNISDDIFDNFDETIVENKSEDWYNYILHTKNLLETYEDGYFETDFGCYSLICLASKTNNLESEEIDIKTKDVKPLYERKRNRILVTKNIDASILQKINKIKAIESYFKETKFEEIDIPNDSTIYLGDNWYLILNNNIIINLCYLEHDEKAKTEIKTTIEILNENIELDKNNIQENNLSKTLKKKKSHNK